MFNSWEPVMMQANTVSFCYMRSGQPWHIVFTAAVRTILSACNVGQEKKQSHLPLITAALNEQAGNSAANVVVRVCLPARVCCTECSQMQQSYTESLNSYSAWRYSQVWYEISVYTDGSMLRIDRSGLGFSTRIKQQIAAGQSGAHRPITQRLITTQKVI